MALVCTRTSVVFVAVMASLTVPATATATFLTSVVCVAVMALLTVLAIARATFWMLVVCVADRVWMRMPTAFATTLTIASAT